MDNVNFGGRDIHNENPAEKLNYHGALNMTNNPAMGANFGYPSCVAVWDPSLITGGGTYKTGQMFKADGTPALRSGWADCSKAAPPAAVFHSHTAPLDIKFTNDSSVAYVAFHGSWNRNPPDGYRVERVEFKGGKPVVPLDSRSAGVPVMENPSTGRCPSGCFRPVGLDFDAKGRLYVSSDSTGEIYVIYGAS
jgi:glucose/arabinose dehydrogenase